MTNKTRLIIGLLLGLFVAVSAFVWGGISKGWITMLEIYGIGTLFFIAITGLLFCGATVGLFDEEKNPNKVIK